MLLNESTALDHVYLPFARVDATNRTITTKCFTTARVRGDKWNLKYETLKRASGRYMQMPCIREMHQHSAAGKALSVHFDDATQTAEMVLRVVDDKAWEKVEEGVYRGVSIGGVPIILRGTDIEEFDWIETSLVDRPKDTGALFVIARAEDGLGAANPIELPADASDEDLEFARGEIAEQLERLESSFEFGGYEIGDLDTESEDVVARYDNAQPRDEKGMWSIVGGHRISVDGSAIDHNTIHAAKAQFGLSNEVTGALLAAHKAGKITTDHHLYRTLSHAEAKNGGLHALATHHIEDGIAHHGAGGSHENRWHSAAHHQAPKLQPGVGIGGALGVHELKTGDVVHFPAHEGKPIVAGVVLKNNPKSIDIGSTVGAAHVGQRISKEALRRPGFVRRNGGSVTAMHHIEVARSEEDTLHDDVVEYAGTLREMLARVESGEETAIEEAAECLNELLERAEGRGGYKTQPRDDVGRWTDGAGKLSVSHVHDVMRHEGIDEQHHHDEVKRKIESGELKTREDVLKHIDSIHEARKNGEKSDEKAKTEGEGDKSKSGKTDDKKNEKKEDKKDDKAPEGKKKPKWHEALKKLAKDTVHAFMNGYRKGKGVARAEEADSIPALVEDFFDKLEDADDDTLAAALRGAILVLSGEEPVERVLDSGDIPARENLEGGQAAPKGRAALEALRSQLDDENWDGDRQTLRTAIDDILNQLARGEGEESHAAPPLARSEDVQRMETLQGTVQRLEGELSTERDSAQAFLQRAEEAEGMVSRLESEKADLAGENQKLRNMPDNTAPVIYGTVPLARSFAANDLLAPENTAKVQRGQLENEYQELQTSLQNEPDASARERGAAKLIKLQNQLAEMRRVS